jgi:uncharacterized protein YjaG (DUF416 family)
VWRRDEAGLEELRVVVDDRVVAALRESSAADTCVFVAGCAERMAQVFTGLQGDDPARKADVELLLRVLDDLWDIRRPAETFLAVKASLEEFPELRPGDEELIDVADVYSFYGVLIARHACAYRASGDVDDAVGVAHAALTAMGQLDQGLGTDSCFADENERQLQSALSARDGGPAGAGLRRTRAADQAVSRARLSVIRDRLTA